MGNNVSGVRQNMKAHVSSLENRLGRDDANKHNNEKIKRALDELKDGLVSSAEAQQIKGLLSNIYADKNVSKDEVQAVENQVKAANADSYSGIGQNSNDKALGDFQRLFHEAARGKKFDHNDLARLIPKIEEHRKTLSGSDLEAFDKVVANFKNSWQGEQFDHNDWSRFYKEQGKGADTSGSNTNT